jgi:AcrR family transcriptional regulator
VPRADDLAAGGTRDRILDAALGLFAKQGFRGTSVDEIAVAAGLTPRSGAVYRHFPTKRSLLDAALDRLLAQRTLDDVLAMLPLGDLRAELTVLARWTLKELRKERDVMRILERDGDLFPELAARYRDEVVQPGYALAGALFRLHFERTGSALDPEVVGAIAAGAVVNYVRVELSYGRPPADLDEQRFLAGWVETWAALSAATPATGPGRRRRRR